VTEEAIIPEDREPTGNEQVDAVLASLSVLDGAPVAEHVAVFEAAHEALRGALATAGETPAPAPAPPRHG
jgi:hypothetical protein